MQGNIFQVQDLIKTNMWFFYVVITVISTGLLHALVARMLRHLTHRGESTRVIFGKALLSALSLPIGFLIWLFGLSFACSIILTHKKAFFL